MRSRSTRDDEEIRSGDNRDSLERPQGKQMTAIPCNNMRRSTDNRTFQNLVVVRVRGHGFELTGDQNDLQESEQIRHGVKRLLRSEGKLGLQFLGQFVQQFSAGYAVDISGACQLHTPKRIPFPADRGEQDVGVENRYFPHARSSCRRSSTKAARSSSESLSQSRPRSAQRRRNCPSANCMRSSRRCAAPAARASSAARFCSGGNCFTNSTTCASLNSRMGMEIPPLT